LPIGESVTGLGNRCPTGWWLSFHVMRVEARSCRPTTLDVLGYISEHLETARLPLWCMYLEEFIRGLRPNFQLPYVVVSAGTVDALLGLLATVCADVQGEPDLDLNDGEYGWEEKQAETMKMLHTASEHLELSDTR
jgi:hypothetical protein